MARTKTQKVTLDIEFDPDLVDSPGKWDWDALIDAGEDVRLLSVEPQPIKNRVPL